MRALSVLAYVGHHSCIRHDGAFHHVEFILWTLLMVLVLWAVFVWVMPAGPVWKMTWLIVRGALAFVPLTFGIWASEHFRPAEVGMTWHPLAGAAASIILVWAIIVRLPKSRDWVDDESSQPTP